MKTRKITYWVTTTLVALGMAMGGVMDLMRGPEVAEILGHLGYPLYFGAIIGFWKVLAAPALLAPGLPRLKEWAYAGVVFDLTGAAFSHASVGDDAGAIITPLVFLALTVASWALRPEDRVLGSLSQKPTSEAPPREALAHA
jgi:hypothetical protein